MGLEVIEQVNPDLVFVDIRMPVMDGLQVIEHMNEQKWTHEVIILTGYKDFHYAQTALRCGAVEYLLKPCPEEQVLGVLDQVFQKNSPPEVGKREPTIFQRVDDPLLTLEFAL